MKIYQLLIFSQGNKLSENLLFHAEELVLMTQLR